MARLAERAAEGGGATIAWLAENDRLPRKYLEQVLRDLKQAELIDSRSGPGGGCRLARPASEITVGDVVRALDGAIRPGHCVDPTPGSDDTDCPGCWGPDTCSMRELWLDLQAAISRVLDNITIADLVRRQRELLTAQAHSYAI